MARKGPRQVVFVCSAVLNGKLVSEMIELETSDEAQKRFQTKHNTRAESVLGPFFRKRTGVLLNNAQTDIHFSGKSRPGVYNEWYVKGMLLDRPEDCVWVFFDQRVDGKKQPKPQSFVMKSEDLHFLTPEEMEVYKNLTVGN